jgi:hypothetical protein
LLQQATAERFASVRLDHAWLTAMVCYAEAAIHLTAQGPAAALMEVLGPWSDQMCGNGLSFEGPVAHYLGGLAAVLDRQDEAAMWFAKSAALCEKEKVKFFGARTDLEWGRMLLTASRSGDRREAARHLESSRHSAAANGYATVERRATAALGGAR